MTENKYDYPRPAYTADCVVFNEAEVLLIERGKEPFKGKLALPGGFVNEGETSKQAAQRELSEETNLFLPSPKLIGIYDSPGRDPRGWVISAAYRFRTRTRNVKAGDDAVRAIWVPINRLTSDMVAFDHYKIIHEALDSEKV
jgi:ADP-ribose pyrophosphatase YjhB (NUDIX family)